MMDSPNVFRCGPNPCREGYEYCLRFPKVRVGEEECWSCSQKEYTCWTEEQQHGCKQYCDDLKSAQNTEPSDQGPQIPVIVIVSLMSVLLVVAIMFISYRIWRRRRRSMERKQLQDIEANQGNSPTSTLLTDSKSSVSTERSSSGDDMASRKDADATTPLSSTYSDTDQDSQVEAESEGSNDRTSGRQETTPEMKIRSTNDDKLTQVNPSSHHNDSTKLVTSHSRHHP